MGIDVRVESERGAIIAQVDDPGGWPQIVLPTRVDPDSYCLRFVDRFGDAVFNQLQIPLLISELRRQGEKVTDPDRRRHAESILELVESAEGKVHTYVRFISD